MMKKLLALLLALCMVFALCACGAGNDNKEDENNNNAVNNEVNDDAKDESEDDSEEDVQTQASFQVKIVDEGGNPVQGCMVQVCKDTCLPAISNAEGIATFSLQIEDGHKLQVSSCPAGYQYDGEENIYLEPGQTEYTLMLKAVQ